MRTLYEFLRNVQLLVFVGLAIAAVLNWRRTKSPAAAWLAASFVILGGVVLVGRLLPVHSSDALVVWARKISISLLVLFPYCLWRFALSFFRPVPWFWWLAHGLTAALAIGILFFPELPEQGEARTPAFQAYVLLLLVQWVGLSLRVTVKLWKAGRGQPSVARRRMRTLALGSLGLALALLLAGTADPSREITSVQIVTQLLALLSGPFFLMGFAPPGIVRLAWRRPEEEALRAAQFGLMQATGSEDVAEVLLPHVARLVGGQSAVLFDTKGNAIATYDTEGRDAVQLLAAEESVTKVELESGHLAVVASPYSPFFGKEEELLFRELALLADLALARVELLGALKRSNEELEQFAYVASHDLQEPLRTVASYAELLSKKLDDQLDDKGRRYVHYVVDGCARMQNLINDLLDFSRIGTRGRDFQRTDLREVVDEALVNLSVAVSETGANIVVDGLPVVEADPNQLTLAVQNLISNSIKFAGDDAPHVTISAERQNGDWLIAVEDRGIGIDPRYADRIFTIFQRLHTRDEYPGTGIGLAICKKIVERHGGTMWLDPRPGPGSKFCFTLPAIEEVPDGSEHR